MITESEIIARARSLLSGKPTFANDSSQFMEELSTVLAVGVHKAVQESNSDRNEFYTETAQLDSSLLAKASDEGRIPNRPLPQIVKCDITSEGYQKFDGDSAIISDIGTKYIFEGTVIVDGNTVQAILRQEEKNLYSYIPTAEEWQEFMVGGKKTSRFFVYSNGLLWEDYENIGDLESNGKGYITRYNILDQLYIRTGNNFLGKVPDSQIDIVSYDTEAKDIQVEAPLYAEGIEQSVEIKVVEILQSSQSQESAQSVAKSLPFWRLKLGGSGYDTDYIDDVMKEFPEALSVRAWGEKRESIIYDRDNINVIYISALREENQSSFGYEVIELLRGKKHILQVQFEWRDPILVPSSITITGQIERTKSIPDSATKIKTAIGKYYSLYAEKADRKNAIYKSFMNSIIQSTLVFENLLPNKPRNQEPEFEAVISGNQMPSSPRDIIYIPVENITTDITFISNV
ncbi:hypothetical protein KAR91_55900 [Candidatus Pacearchaeota archaeon]|nr:hypothetical protein [Candidatus Pacearchaeota archaeon]